MILVIVNVVAFLLQLAFQRSFPVHQYFALSVDGLRHGFVWQLLTFQMMHGGWIHLLLNCWMLYMFGRDVEESLGRSHFLWLYFASGVVGGLLQILSSVVFPLHFGAGPVVGASAGVSGLIAAFATLHPERPLTIFLYLIIPVKMRAKFLLLFLAIVAALGMAFPHGFGANIAHAAHLGGMIAGVLFVRFAMQWNWHWPRFGGLRRTPAQRLVKVHSKNAAAWKANAIPADEDLPPEEFLSREVDPILDKISAHGIQSLTERERRVLEAARARMAKR
jgi:membrane associated rhomboid family serine protease